MKIKFNPGTLTRGRSRAASGFLAVLMLAACTSSHVLVGERRQAISPDEVRLYLHPPAKYDEVALLNSTSMGAFALTEQGRSDVVIERLKKEAASLGANGVLLQGVSDQQSGAVGSVYASGTGSHAFGISSSTGIYGKSGAGMAIYVPPDPTAAR